MNNVTVGAANFSTAVTAGNFSVNGKQVAIATSDSLQDVFDKIAAATGNAVTASYDKTTDKITLSSASSITLGNTGDTSNFLPGRQTLQQWQRHRGQFRQAGPRQYQRDAQQCGSQDGHFRRGSVHRQRRHHQLQCRQDTVQSVLDNINSSAAGVSASYDTTNNRFVLTNKTTGSMGIALRT